MELTKCMSLTANITAKGTLTTETGTGVFDILFFRIEAKNSQNF